jgi:hypothetical protein
VNEIRADETTGMANYASPELLRLVMKVEEMGVPILIEACENGWLHVRIAAKIAELDEELQNALLSDFMSHVD